MSLWQYAILGAGGGALVEALTLFKWISVWQNARRRTTGELEETPPSWRRYVDVAAHAWLLVIRMPLGAGAALLFGATGQISGAYAAVAFGFAAPAVLAQLGAFPQVADAVKTDKPQTSPASNDLTDRAGYMPTVESAEEGGA